MANCFHTIETSINWTLTGDPLFPRTPGIPGLPSRPWGGNGNEEQRWSAFAGLCSKVFFTFPALCDNQPLPPSLVELNGIASTWRNPAPHPHPSSVAFVSVPYALFICTNLSHTTLSSLGHCLTFRPDSPDSPTLPGNPSWPCGENKFHIIWDKYTFVLLSL